jgi:lysine-specific demethylase 8
MKNLDTCCVISGSPGIERRFISNIILDQLQHYLTQGRGIPHVYKKLQRTKQHVDVTYPITRLEEPPSFEWFLQHCDQDIPTPFIIPKGMIDDWPATSTHPWGSLEYLLSVAGDRVVPVEIGSQYTDSNWSQKMMRFSDFIEKYIQIQDGIPAYLAQHDLFYQVPRLEKDIIVPDYCYIEPRLTPYYSVRAKDVIKNAWFGPKNTISPLHQDPYHNLLVQVNGSKYIKLVSPEETKLVYPRQGLMSNTSQVSIVMNLISNNNIKNINTD